MPRYVEALDMQVEAPCPGVRQGTLATLRHLWEIVAAAVARSRGSAVVAAASSRAEVVAAGKT